MVSLVRIITAVGGMVMAENHQKGSRAYIRIYPSIW